MGRGGAESMIMNYYRNIDRSKVQFDFLVHKEEKGDFDDEIYELGGRIHKIRSINPIFSKNYYEELRLFFKNNPDYSIVHSHINTFSSFPLKIAKEYKIPVRIAHAHTSIEAIGLKELVFGGESFKEQLKKLFKIQLKKRINNYVTHRFSCGEKAGLWLFGESHEFEVINNAIDSEMFKFNPDISRIYKKEDSLENDVVIGHVGRFSSVKNHSYLLKIFNELIKIKRNCKLVLVGEGELKGSIKREIDELGIKDHVIFLGLREDVHNLYQMFDLFVFPSFYEGLPVVLIEAQASGLKILASDTVTNEVRVTDDIEFYSINKNPKEWSERIMKLIPYERKNNQSKIKSEGYDIKLNAKKMQEFYLDSVCC